jgi:DnaK suppressor protein
VSPNFNGLALRQDGKLFVQFSWAALATALCAETVNYIYDAAGRLAIVDYGNGRTITYVYDNAGNLLSRVAAAASSSSAGQKNFESFGLPHHYQPMGTSMAKKRPAQQDQKTNGYRQILLEKRASALAGLGAQTHYLAQAERICEEDQAQNSLEEAVSLRLNGHEYTQLRQIQEALDRLQLGEYGICLSCAEAIPSKRLDALPWAKHCVKCQEKIGEGTLEAD